MRTPVAAGEPIRDPEVVVRQGRRLPGRRLAQGHARGIDGHFAENGAGGFILPNDHVDVMLTRRDKAAEKVTGVEKFVSETILRNVRVLAVDQAVEEKDGQKVVVGKTATIELDPAASRNAGAVASARHAVADAAQPA